MKYETALAEALLTTSVLFNSYQSCLALLDATREPPVVVTKFFPQTRIFMHYDVYGDVRTGVLTAGGRRKRNGPDKVDYFHQTMRDLPEWEPGRRRNRGRTWMQQGLQSEFSLQTIFARYTLLTFPPSPNRNLA